jgi:V/A-type H+-transporting ATPase subunit K
MLRKMIFLSLAMVVVLMTVAPFASAAEGAEGAAAAQPMDLGGGLRAAGLAIGAGISVAAGALATARAQAAIGASGIGALAEKRDMFAMVLIFVALPETLIIIGFVMAFLLFSKIV